MLVMDDTRWTGGIQRSGKAGAIATKEIFAPDGSPHTAGLTSGSVTTPPYTTHAATLETTDGTAIKFSGTADGNGVLIEPNGTRHSVTAAGTTTSPAFVREDVDGKEITQLRSQALPTFYVDTLNRQIPLPPPGNSAIATPRAIRHLLMMR